MGLVRILKTRFKPSLDLVQTCSKCNFHTIKFEKGEFLQKIINQIMVEHRRGYICNIYRLLNEYSVLGPSSLVGI